MNLLQGGLNNLLQGGLNDLLQGFLTNLLRFGLTAFYFGGVTALLVFFGMLFAIFRFASKEYNKAKDKGFNPYIPAMWGAMAGFAVGVFVVTMWLFILRFIGFMPELYVCLFFTGRVGLCADRYLKDPLMILQLLQLLP